MKQCDSGITESDGLAHRKTLHLLFYCARFLKHSSSLNTSGYKLYAEKMRLTNNRRKKRGRLLTNTHTHCWQHNGLACICRITEGREESLPSIGRENKWKDTEKKESTKRKACLKRYIRANRKQR